MRGEAGPLRPLHLGSHVNALKGVRAPGGRGEQRTLAAVELSLNEHHERFQQTHGGYRYRYTTALD